MLKKLVISFVSVFISLLGITACTQENEQEMQESAGEMIIRVMSSAFTEGETIPKKYTCDADNISPPIAWADPPEGTRSLALTMDDPDAPAGTWIHWVLYDIPADQHDLPEGVKGVGITGKNTSGKISYGGPCPPKGSAHRYLFKVYALDSMLELDAGLSKADLEKAMQGHILAQGQLVGRYQR